MVDYFNWLIFGICILLGIASWILTWSSDQFLIGYFLFAIFFSSYVIYGIYIIISRAFNRVQEIRKGRAAKKRVPNESDSDEEESGFQPIKF